MKMGQELTKIINKLYTTTSIYYFNNSKGHLLGHSACTTKIGDYYRDGFHVEKNP